MERYLSPKDGIITTIVLPAFSGRLPTVRAARTAAPEDIPQSTPCFDQVYSKIISLSIGKDGYAIDTLKDEQVN